MWMAASSRSRSTVNIRAMSLRIIRIWFGFSSVLACHCKRRLNSSARLPSTCSCRAAVSMSRISAIFILHGLLTRNRIGTLDELGLDRHLEPGQAQRLPCRVFVDVGHLEHDAPRLDHTNPVIDCAFTFTHTGFGRLCGPRPIAEECDPNPATG